MRLATINNMHVRQHGCYKLHKTESLLKVKVKITNYNKHMIAIGTKTACAVQNEGNLVSVLSYLKISRKWNIVMLSPLK